MKITLVSVAPEAYIFNRPTFRYSRTLPAADKIKGYSTCVFEDGEDCKVIYQGLKTEEIERVPFPVSAESIVKDFFQSEQLADKGVFALPEGRTEPTSAEVAEAQVRRHKLMVSWVLEGDRLYSQFGERGIQRIPDYCKRAVAELNERRGWVFTPSLQKAQCEGCGKMVELLMDGSKPAICAGCGAPIDREKAIRLGLWAPPEPKPRVGRPPKVKPPVEEHVTI